MLVFIVGVLAIVVTCALAAGNVVPESSYPLVVFGLLFLPAVPATWIVNRTKPASEQVRSVAFVDLM